MQISQALCLEKKVPIKPINFLIVPSNLRPKPLVETIHVTYDDKLLGPLNRKYIIQIPRCKLNSSNQDYNVRNLEHDLTVN